MPAIPVPPSLTAAEIQPLLRPADCLLYRPTSFEWKHPGRFGWIFGDAIDFRSWHDVCHCEMYIANGKSVASRDGQGVAMYPWRNTELQYVLRPTVTPLHWRAFWPWFYSVNGEAYDWWGLLRFAWFKDVGHGDNHKMFCSEFLARAYRALGAQVIGDNEDADAVAPFEFLLSPNLVSLDFTTYGTTHSA